MILIWCIWIYLLVWQISDGEIHRNIFCPCALKAGVGLGLKVVKHKTGGDPATVVFDAVEYAKAHNKDAVLADTTGRLQTNNQSHGSDEKDRARDQARSAHLRG
jgi:hypothetical protein